MFSVWLSFVPFRSVEPNHIALYIIGWAISDTNINANNNICLKLATPWTLWQHEKIGRRLWHELKRVEFWVAKEIRGNMCFTWRCRWRLLDCRLAAIVDGVEVSCNELWQEATSTTCLLFNQSFSLWYPSTAKKEQPIAALYVELYSFVYLPVVAVVVVSAVASFESALRIRRVPILHLTCLCRCCCLYCCLCC